MIWFPLILAVQFIGLLPSRTQAIVIIKPKDPVKDTLPGTVLVKDVDKSDPICSGFLLQPWIVLTTAECVKDKEADNLAVTVWYQETVPHPSSTDPTDVSVAKVYIDPTYGSAIASNFAVLIIYGQVDWVVGKYTIAPYEITSETFPDDSLFVYMWETSDDLNYKTVLVPSVQGNYTTCGFLTIMYNPDFKYCLVNKNPPPHEYSQVDVGTPAFFGEDNQKMVFAIFSHYSPGKYQRYAHLALWPRYNWIQEVCEEHPMPPE